MSGFSVGSNGNNSVNKKDLHQEGACKFEFFKTLTDCGGNSKEWTWSNDGDVIKVLSPDATWCILQVRWPPASLMTCTFSGLMEVHPTKPMILLLMYNQGTPQANPVFPNAPKYHVVIKKARILWITLDPIEGSWQAPFIWNEMTS